MRFYVDGTGDAPGLRSRVDAVQARCRRNLALLVGARNSWPGSGPSVPAQLARLEERRAAGAARHGPPAGVDDYIRVRQAAARLDKARVRAAEDERSAGKDPGPVRNITDPDSRLMPVRGGGFI